MKKTGRATMKIDCQTNVKPLWAAFLFLAAWLCSASQASADRALLQKVASHPQVAAFRENRARVADNPYRPRYHMSAPDKLMHDPNGLCQWQGRYHLFYQYVVEREGWIVHWGHAYSDDLIHWRDLPAAIKPSVEKSCFSGQTLVEADRVIAMYHGREAGNMIAVSRDPLLMEWEKLSENPVIPIHTEESPYRVFDPCLWKGEDGAYYSLSGSYRDGEKRIDCLGETHVFRSKNLSDWEWLGPFFTDTLWAERGEDMVVPNFWPVGNGKRLLLCFSHKRGGRGYVGKLDRASMRFHADYHFRANHGEMRHASIHAPSATLDDQGRYVAIFNMKEARGIKHEGWDGIMSLPRVYSLAEDYYYTEAISEESVRHIRNHDATQHLFLYIAHYAPHFPLEAPEERIDRYRERYGIENGEIHHGWLHINDLLPTCLELAGRDYPESFAGRPLAEPDGRSLMPLLAGRHQPKRDLFYEHESSGALITGKWKLARGDRSEPWKLFDLEEDPFEQRNVAADYPGVRDDLLCRWNAWGIDNNVFPLENLPWNRRILHYENKNPDQDGISD